MDNNTLSMLLVVFVVILIIGVAKLGKEFLAIVALVITLFAFLASQGAFAH